MDKNIPGLGPKTNEFHPSDLTIFRDFVSNKDVKVTYAKLLEALGSGNGLNAYQVAVLEGYEGTVTEWLDSLVGDSAYQIAVANGFVGTEVDWLLSLKGDQGEPGEQGPQGEQGIQGEPGPAGGITGFPESDGKVYGIKNQAPFELVDTTAGRRVISTELVITGSTSGVLNSQWYNNAEVLRTLTDEPVTFPALPAAGNFRWVLVEGLDDGTFALNSQTPDATTAIRPTPTADRVILGEAIFDADGNVQQPSPGGGNTNVGPFPVNRYTTQVAANTTGKYAKIWEGALSRDNNYAIHLSYHEPITIDTDQGSGLCRLRMSFTCDPSRNIVAETLQLQTDGNSVAGEFQLVQITGNKAALYHRSNHFWGRIQYRVLFCNSSVRNQDFVVEGAYVSSLPGGTVYASVVASGGSSYYPSATFRESNTVLFDGDYITGVNAAPRNGNILFDFTGAKLGAVTIMYHQDASAFTFPTEAELNFDTATEISTTKINKFMMVLVDDTPSAQKVDVMVNWEGGTP